MTPTFHPNRLDDPLKVKKPSRIFVGSSGDLWGKFIPTDWIHQILEIVKKCPQHTFQFLTKNPSRYVEFNFPDNCWIGTTIDTQARADANLDDFKKAEAEIKFISFEPLLEEINVDLRGIDWIIIGGCTGDNKDLPTYPNKLWVNKLRSQCLLLDIPIFIKNNAGLKNISKDFPKEKKLLVEKDEFKKSDLRRFT